MEPEATESQLANEQASSHDREWLTIKSFFRNSLKVTQLLKNSEKYLFEGSIDKSYFQKCAKIY